MDLSSLQQAWALPGPWHLAPLAYGTNNLVQRVQTPAGSYVLGVYRNHADLSRLRFEAAILTRLQGAGLAFAVPAPIPTAAGEPYERLTTEEGEALATLTPLIPGEHPRRDDLGQAPAAGEALGLLDVALARITPPNPEEGVGWRSYGDLARCHPLVPDPLTAIAELPMAAETRQRLAGRYTWLTERIPRLYASLPQQLTHEDYCPDNVLMDGVRGARLPGGEGSRHHPGDAGGEENLYDSGGRGAGRGRRRPGLAHLGPRRYRRALRRGRGV